MTIGIYSIELLQGKKQVYIGSSKNIERRFTQHKRLLNQNQHSNKYLQGNWNNYKEYNFVFRILKEFDFYNHEELLREEQLFIDQYKLSEKRIDRNRCFNLHYYAGGGYAMLNTPDELKRIRSINLQGNKFSIGEKSSTATLTNKQVIEIKRLLNTTDITYGELSKQFNTAKRNIDRIAKNQTWQEIGDKVIRNNCRNKSFNKNQIIYIRNSYKSGNKTTTQLSEEFKVHRCTIHRIINYQTYKNI